MDRFAPAPAAAGLALLAPALIGLALAGCATNPDPGQGGFISGVAGLTQGTYQARIDEREQALQAEQAQSTALAGQQQSLSLEQARLNLEAQQLRYSLASQRQRIEELRRQYRVAQSAGDRMALARLDAVAQRADTELATSGAADLSGPELERKVADLRSLIGDMNGLVQELGTEPS